MKIPKKGAMEEFEHPTEEVRNFHPEDTQLRALGFTIHSRPKGGEVIWLWNKDGRLYPQSQAESKAKKLLKEKKS